MDFKELSLKDFAFTISDYLIKHGIEVVLTGGACIVIYSDYKYMSYDLDFVLMSTDKQKQVRQLMVEIGFYEKGRYFKHDDSEYFIDFLPSPLSVGEEPVKEISTIEKEGCILKLLSPTDCVKDRLTAFYHWDDRQSLEQAILVCLNNDIEIKEVERWSKNEGMQSKFRIFKESLTEKELTF